MLTVCQSQIAYIFYRLFIAILFIMKNFAIWIRFFKYNVYLCKQNEIKQKYYETIKTYYPDYCINGELVNVGS